MAYTDSPNYTGLTTDEKAAVATAVAAIKAAYADTAGDQGKKYNVRALLREIVDSMVES